MTTTEPAALADPLELRDAGDSAALATAGAVAVPAQPAAGRWLARPVWTIWGVAFDARMTQIAVLATLILILAFNNRFVQGEYDRFVLEFLIPLAWVVAVWREDPRRFGLTLGDWRLGLPITVAGIAAMAAIIWIAGQQPDFRSYYTDTIDGRPAARLILDTAIDIFAWEFFFRGWMLWSLGRKIGTDAIWIQVIPFALMHVWKPEIEQLSTVVGGLFFGLLAWRTRSFVWGFLLHWFMVAWVLMVTAGYV